MCSIIISYMILVLLNSVESARILGVFSFPSISHQSVFQPIWKELSLRGHEVIVVTPNPIKDPSLTNLTEIDFGDSYQFILKNELQEIMADKTIAEQMHNFFCLTHDVIEQQLNNEEFQKILNDPNQQFDLILYESVYPIMVGLSHRFKAPIIGITSLAPLLNLHDIVGNPSHPVTNADIVLDFHGNLNFRERWFSTYHSVYYRLYHYFYILPKSDSTARKYFGTDMPYIGDLEKNVDMVFSSSNPLMNSIRPIVPALIEMRFMQIKPKKSLPKDLQVILDEAKEGVIYFSLGSNVKSVNLDENLRNVIIGALSELPYKVIWKWESDHMPGKPDNVIIRKWLPQQDVLGHPNIKAFVTQGGLQSLEEAVANAIPVVGMPFFGDQPMNVAKVASHGFGIALHPNTVTKDELKKSIIEVAENKKYRQKIEELRDILLDQPMIGVEKAVWWAEYVIRHKGAKHLRSATLNIPLYQYFLLDVIAATVAVILVSIYIIYKITKLIIHCTSRPTNKLKHN